MSNQKYIKGAENIPLRQVNTSMPAYVIIYNLQNDDEVVLEKRIDYASAEDRKWLGRISFWAMTNHHSVETMALIDIDIPNVDE